MIKVKLYNILTFSMNFKSHHMTMRKLSLDTYWSSKDPSKEIAEHLRLYTSAIEPAASLFIPSICAFSSYRPCYWATKCPSSSNSLDVRSLPNKRQNLKCSHFSMFKVICRCTLWNYWIRLIHWITSLTWLLL